MQQSSNHLRVVASLTRILFVGDFDSSSLGTLRSDAGADIGDGLLHVPRQLAFVPSQELPLNIQQVLADEGERNMCSDVHKELGSRSN